MLNCVFPHFEVTANIFVVSKRSMKKLSITFMIFWSIYAIQYKSMDIFPPISSSASPSQKSFILMLTALYSQDVQIFLQSKTKKKDIGFLAAQ